MASGIVKWFNAEKGFGFIQPASGGKDIFIHVSALDAAGIDNLREGQKVSYEIENDRKGRPNAVKLELE